MLRKIVLMFLKSTARDITIKHHLTSNKFSLNSYNHKGYWYYGKKREKETISVFEKWIKPDFKVLEVGGHIGYFTTYFAQLTGKGGQVKVFEPSNTNLRYLQKNVELQKNNLDTIVEVIQKGVGDAIGELDFYIDPISGQNNSFVKDFDGFKSSRQHSAEVDAELKVEKVPVVTLDSFCQEQSFFPDFVKIDVEGFEWNVIKGFMSTIEQKHPSIMIEIQADVDKIIPYFLSIGYTVYNDKLEQIRYFEDYKVLKSPNIFFKYK